MTEPVLFVDPEQAAEQHPDYRILGRITRGLALLSISGLVFLAWYLVAYRAFKRPVETGIFLLTTTLLAAVLSIGTGLAAFFLFKRRGGHVEKTAPPPGLEPRRKHFGPPPTQKP